jgi:hypothetical protein
MKQEAMAHLASHSTSPVPVHRGVFLACVPQRTYCAEITSAQKVSLSQRVRVQTPDFVHSPGYPYDRCYCCPHCGVESLLTRAGPRWFAGPYHPHDIITAASCRHSSVLVMVLMSRGKGSRTSVVPRDQAEDDAMRVGSLSTDSTYVLFEWLCGPVLSFYGTMWIEPRVGSRETAGLLAWTAVGAMSSQPCSWRLHPGLVLLERGLCCARHFP